MAVPRRRLDSRLVDDSLAVDLREARGLIMRGDVVVGDKRADKPGLQVRDDTPVRLRNAVVRKRFVSRGGDKLDAALDDLDLAVASLDCLDVGASTGGFTDCLLQRGAARVIALDVGYGLLADALRRDPRVLVHERTNARTLTPDQLPFSPALTVVDASFISLRSLLPALTAVAVPGGYLLAMVKPQFELPRAEVPQGGVVRDEGARRRASASVTDAASGLGWHEVATVDSRVAGPEGNVERFVLLRRPPLAPDERETRSGARP